MDRDLLIALPLPYYSKESYDICNDVHRGGWLWCGLRIVAHRMKDFSVFSGVQITLRWGCFWRFKGQWINEVRRG